MVLDFGCGEGYGSAILTPLARAVTSLDSSREAVAITNRKYQIPVVQADARAAPFHSEVFELIVSFEVFEHITGVENFLREAYRLLKPGGYFILSTPNVDHYPLAGLNPYHVKEYSPEEVVHLLRSVGFGKPRIFAQVPRKREIERLQKSQLLLIVMKVKRWLGFHGNLLPGFIRQRVNRTIAGGKIGAFDSSEYQFIEGKLDESDLVYLSLKH